MSENTAIILIDPYKDFLHPEGKLYPGLAASLAENKTIEHFKQLVAVARAHKIPIYHGLHQQHHEGFAVGWKHISELQQIQIDSKAFEERSWGVEFLEGLEPDVKNGDVIVSKHWSSSSFQSTDLDYQLHQREITNVIVAGLESNTCFEATSRYAYELWYHVIMLRDCTAAFDPAAMKAASELIWHRFANVVTTVGEWSASLEAKEI